MYMYYIPTAVLLYSAYYEFSSVSSHNVRPLPELALRKILDIHVTAVLILSSVSFNTTVRNS